MAESFNSFLQQLYEAHYERMIQVAYRLTGGMETARDLVQAVFLLALMQQQTLLSHPKPEGWLMITVRNLALNERRKTARHPQLPLELFSSLSGGEPELSLELLLPRQLSEDDRTVLLWRFQEGLNYREIADRLGISESGSRSRVSRAVARCRTYMEES